MFVTRIKFELENVTSTHKTCKKLYFNNLLKNFLDIIHRSFTTTIYTIQKTKFSTLSVLNHKNFVIYF